MSPEQASEKQYPMPSEEKYHGLARTIDQDSEEFDEMAREYLELQMASSKQRAAFLSGVSWQRENGWQPIETAPKDGTEIQAGWIPPFDKQTGTPICWQETEGKEGWFLLSPQGRHVTGRFPDYGGQWLHESDYPNHWQPLTPAPVSIINK